jgi:hypothetical protein
MENVVEDIISWQATNKKKISLKSNVQNNNNNNNGVKV